MCDKNYFMYQYQENIFKDNLGGFPDINEDNKTHIFKA